jgi:DNA-binding NtrC family response regulator
VVLSSGPTVTLDLLPDHIVGRDAALQMLEHRADASLFDIVEECERRIIADMLEKCNGNQTDAAGRFKIPLSTLNQKIKRLSIEIKKRGREA